MKLILSDYQKEIDAKTGGAVKQEELKAIDHYSNDVVIKPGGLGVVQIHGALTPAPSALYDFFGVSYTAYSDIREQIETLENDKSVKSILLDINSPGGDVTGLYSTMETIANTTKPVNAIGSGVVASAAYMLASQADTISAVDELTLFGSVGVVIDAYIDDNQISVTNTDSPEKRNDLKTEAGIKNEQKKLDDIYGILEEKIASGRGVDTDTIKSNYGQGAVMTARTALKNGVIDSVENNKPADKATKQELKTMDLAQLKADHSDLYNSIFASGKEAGKKELKGLTEAHLKLADASGDMEQAMKDIVAGVEVDSTVIAHHGAQQIKRMQIDARQEEQPAPVDASSEPEIDEQAKLEKEIQAIEGLEVEL